MLSGNRNCFQIKPIHVIKINRIIFKVWVVSSKIKFAIFYRSQSKTDFQQKRIKCTKCWVKGVAMLQTTDGKIQLKYSLSWCYINTWFKMSFKTRILHFWQWHRCGAMRRWSRGCGIKALKRTWAGRITNSVLTQSSKIFILNFRYLGWRDVAWVLFCWDYTLTHHTIILLQLTKRLHSRAIGKKSVFKCSIVNCKFSKWKVPGDGAVTSFDGSRNHNTAALNNTTTSLHTDRGGGSEFRK